MKSTASPSELPDESSPRQPFADSRALELAATAYHEAGHAVMATILGRKIQKVTIASAHLQTGGVRLGVCELGKGRTKASHDAVEDEVLILLAGMVAEAQFTGQYCSLGASHDLRLVNRLLADRGGSERQFSRVQRRMLEKTEHLLSETAHAKAIALVARELITRTTISGRNVRHIVDQSLVQAS